jgi:hypothetical protein
MAKFYHVDQSTLNILALWHSGQWFPTYSVLSMKGGTAEAIERAIDELEALQTKGLAKELTKYTLTELGASELAFLIDSLKEIIKDHTNE